MGDADEDEDGDLDVIVVETIARKAISPHRCFHNAPVANINAMPRFSRTWSDARICWSGGNRRCTFTLAS